MKNPNLLDYSNELNFNELYLKYSPLLYRYLSKKYSRESKDNLKDIVQETFFTIYRKMASIKPNLNIFNFIITIAINKLKDHYKKEKKISKDDIYLLPLFELDICKLESNELSCEIIKTIDLLPEKYKIVINKYYFEGLKIAEISKELNLNQNTIKTVLKRAKQTLKKNKIMKKVFDQIST